MSINGENTQRPTLNHLQQWMQAVITHPGGFAPGLASTEAQRSIRLDANALNEVITSSARLSAAQHLAIYCRSYHARLLQCFQSMFPSLLYALGEDLFSRFAFDYLQHYPPQSYTLDQLADGFPRHLAETSPNANAALDQRESWPDFIIELATLELAFLKVYDGPGIEAQLLPESRTMGALSAEHFLALRPVPAPCLRLFTFRYPVRDYFLAARHKEMPQLPAPAETFVAMTRRNYRVALHELTSSQYVFLEALSDGHTVDQALNSATFSAAAKPELIETVRDWLSDWVNIGYFASVEVQVRNSFS
jgi:putative DNA-binding protein